MTRHLLLVPFGGKVRKRVRAQDCCAASSLQTFLSSFDPSARGSGVNVSVSSSVLDPSHLSTGS